METKITRYTFGDSALTAPIVALIVDDHPISADGMRNYLETASDIQVAAICGDAKSAKEDVAHFQPDIVIVDLVLDGSHMDGIELCRYLRLEYQTIKLLVVSAFSDPRRVLGAVSVGVDGYLIKTSPSYQLIRAVYDLMDGLQVWDPKVSKMIRLYIGDNMDSFMRFAQDHYDAEPVLLSDRELDVLKLLAHGYKNQEIANRLFIAAGTVKTHVKNIFEKLRVADRGQARVWYHINRHRYE